MRPWLGPFAATLAVLSAGLETGASAGSVAARCHTADLAARLKAGSPGAGQRYATLFLRNRSRHRCTVMGYVGARLVTARGRPLATRVVRDRTRSPRRVTLAPGRSAAARLHWGVVAGKGEPEDRQCQPTPSRILITPPDETTQLSLRWPFGPVCQHGRIDTRPLRHA